MSYRNRRQQKAIQPTDDDDTFTTVPDRSAEKEAKQKAARERRAAELKKAEQEAAEAAKQVIADRPAAHEQRYEQVLKPVLDAVAVLRSSGKLHNPEGRGRLTEILQQLEPVMAKLPPLPETKNRNTLEIYFGRPDVVKAIIDRLDQTAAILTDLRADGAVCREMAYLRLRRTTRLDLPKSVIGRIESVLIGRSNPVILNEFYLYRDKLGMGEPVVKVLTPEQVVLLKEWIGEDNLAVLQTMQLPKEQRQIIPTETIWKVRDQLNQLTGDQREQLGLSSEQWIFLKVRQIDARPDRDQPADLEISLQFKYPIDEDEEEIRMISNDGTQKVPTAADFEGGLVKPADLKVTVSKNWRSQSNDVKKAPVDPNDYWRKALAATGGAASATV